jgi:O-antigen/teichoic acid export membrane protein
MVGTEERSAAQRQIRGSSLLLIGRFLSRGGNFAVQVLTVRYLSMTDFGAFAYALSIVQLGQTVATCGLDRALTRFVPIYQERGEFGKVFGTLFMVAGTILAAGLAIALGVQLFQPQLARLVESDLAYALLLVLVFLVPIQAFDDLLVGLFAVFAKPRAIFFRRHVVAPALKLVVVLALVLGQGTVFFLAGGYLAASLAGVAIYLAMLVRLVRATGLLEHFSRATLMVPWREVLSFTVPLLVSDLVYVVMNATTVLILGHFHGLADVAFLRAQQPIAAINQLVMVSFATLFTPMASRLFARGDRAGINALYWQTAMWIAVLSFPAFVLTFSVAAPLTTLVLGERYADSATLLRLLAVGYYFNAALGFNGLTLKIYGKLRYVIVIGLVTVAISLGASFLLVPSYGALGAATAIGVSLVAHNVLKQAGLRLGTGITVFEWRYLRGYGVIVLAAGGVLAIQAAGVPPVAAIALALLASWLVFRVNRDLLDVQGTFPELLRNAPIRWLLGVPRPR